MGLIAVPDTKVVVLDKTMRILQAFSGAEIALTPQPIARNTGIPRNLRVFVEIGTPVPLHVGVAGKILLAWLPDTEQTERILASATRYPDHPLGNMQALKTKLDSVREAGWAISEGERAEGLSALAAPIFNVNKEVVATLALVAPTHCLGAHERKRYVPLVRQAARRASLDMGCVVDEKQLFENWRVG